MYKVMWDCLPISTTGRNLDLPISYADRHMCLPITSTIYLCFGLIVILFSIFCTSRWEHLRLKKVRSLHFFPLTLAALSSRILGGPLLPLIRWMTDNCLRAGHRAQPCHAMPCCRKSRWGFRHKKPLSKFAMCWYEKMNYIPILSL